MGYSKFSREAIYKDRTDLKEFGVLIPGTLNHYLFNQMRRLTLLHCGNAKEIALKCFNNAYYICTLTQLDEFPDLCVDEYEEKLLLEKIPFVENVYQASMALVCVLLGAYDVKYKQKDNYLIESIHRATSSNKWVGSFSHKSFEDVINSCNLDGFCIVDGEFEPRDICEAIKNVSVGVLESSAEYVCERLALLNDFHRKKHGADLAIARLKDDLREIYEDYDYDPKKKIFKGDPYYKESFWKEVDPLKAAIDYYTKHYPKRKEVDAPNTIMQESSKIDNASHENDIKNLQAQIKGKDFEIAKLKEQLAAANNTIDHQNTQIVNLNAQLQKDDEKDAIIKEQEERIADYAAIFDPQDINKKKIAAMTGKQHAIFLLAVLAHHDRLPHARTNLSFLLSFIASRNETTMFDYLKGRFTQDECETLAKVFDTDCPFIAEMIRELPEKLEKDKSEKNRAKALKNNNA